MKLFKKKTENYHSEPAGRGIHGRKIPAQNQTNQRGRSMVEMLGVLAIIGVLSVGGVAGYRMAMNTNAVNEALYACQLAIPAVLAKMETTEPEENGTWIARTNVDGRTLGAQIYSTAGDYAVKGDLKIGHGQSFNAGAAKLLIEKARALPWTGRGEGSKSDELVLEFREQGGAKRYIHIYKTGAISDICDVKGRTYGWAYENCYPETDFILNSVHGNIYETTE